MENRDKGEIPENVGGSSFSFFLNLLLLFLLLQNPKTNSTLQAAARAASAGADTPGGGLSPADLARLRAARAAEKDGASPGGSGAGMGSGLFGDVLAEAKLIEWPSLKQALGDTVLVVGIVLGSALLLFVVNTLLADLSKIIY